MSGADKIHGRVVLVTGGARGIGRAIAEALGGRGARVAISDIDEKLAQKTAREIGAWAYAQDVTDRTAWQRTVEAVEADLGPIDILVNNAGIMAVGGFLEQSEASDQRQIDINIHGVLSGMREVLPGMLARDRGHIVNLASAAGRVGLPQIAVYSATKFAVFGLTEAAHNEYRDTGVSFTAVCPSLVKTELAAGTRGPLWPPMATAEDVADAVIRAIERQRLEVYVPRAARLSVVLPALLPRRIVERVARLLRLDQLFTDVDHAARASYIERTTGADATQGAG